MIVVEFEAGALARVRLAASPVAEVLSWLQITAGGGHHAVFGDPGPAARVGLRDPDVVLVGAVVAGVGGYIPDLLTPRPPVGGWTAALGEQLEAVRATPDEVVATELNYRYQGTRMPPEVRRAVDDGTFARRAASGLHRFWRASLSQHGKALAEAATVDLDHWARVMATHGVGHLLATLHPEIVWTGRSLRIAKPYDEISRLTDHEMVIAPNILGRPRLAVQVCNPSNAVLRLPVQRFTSARAGADVSLASLVGVSRAAILVDLARPSSTTELSRRHGLAPSTVSHHLGVLLNSGLVHRRRTGAVVQYRRSHQGDALVANSHDEPPDG